MRHPAFAMRISAIVLNLIILSHQTVSDEQVQLNVGERGGNVTLQCSDHPVNVTKILYRWRKNEVTVAPSDPSVPSDHYSISSSGSLTISGLKFIDEGLYQCDSQTQNISTWQTHTKIKLQITDGPSNVLLDIKPANILENGTLFVRKGSAVSFNCSSESYPSQNMMLSFENSARNDSVKRSGSESSLEFSISKIQPEDQGTYTCISQNTLSNRTANKSQELLVYYAPERHPECSWELGNGASDVLFICTWYGGYPVPTLDWHEVLEESVIAKGPTINSTSQKTERLKVHVNRFILHDGEEVKCIGHHITGEEKNCSFNLKIPYPLGEPMVTAVVGSNVTLSCTEISSLPPAKTVWRQKDNQMINTTSKYIVSENRPTYTLTIVNVTEQDQGIFYCYSENPLGARELEVVLTVKTSAGSGGVVVGVFVSVLIVMIGITVGVTVYSKRDRICIGLGFSNLDEDRTDVLSLVDSDDEEEIFHDAVPRLPPPPLTNGHATTLVEIHRIPSSDHEDNTEHTDQPHYDQTELVQ